MSGPGSNPDIQQTKNLVVNLDSFIKNNNIKSILDMPCGDFAWMKKIIELNQNLKYYGFDIVKEIIDLNAQRYGSDNVKFVQKDI